MAQTTNHHAMLEAQFSQAVKAAQDLNDPLGVVVNEEYVRGQAELICNLFAIDTEHKETLIDVISGRIDPLQALYDCLSGTERG